MHRRFFCALMALTLLFLTPARAGAASTADFVRLHVVAAGDSAEEQAVKLRVRDACLEVARARLAQSADADEAFARLNADLNAFRTAAVLAAREAGFAGEVTVETGAFDFPDRLYGDVFVPAGIYRALRVTLGEGEGHNWWCVLYPSLCVLDEAAYCAGEQPPLEFYSSLGRFFGGLWGR